MKMTKLNTKSYSPLDGSLASLSRTLKPAYIPLWAAGKYLHTGIKHTSPHPFPIPDREPFQDLTVFSDTNYSEVFKDLFFCGTIDIDLARTQRQLKSIPLIPIPSTCDVAVATMTTADNEDISIPKKMLSNDFLISSDNKEIAHTFLYVKIKISGIGKVAGG